MKQRLISVAIFSTLGLSLLILQGCATTPPPKAAATPAPAPAWKQGMGPDMANSKLAPMPGKMTVTAASEIPIDKLKLPPGFKIEVWATGMPGARAMARGDDGKIYIGTRAIGRVYELSDNGKERTSRVLVDKLVQPAGVAFNNGSLYGSALRWD